MAQLNSAQSIIDFTKSRNLPSDFESRKKLFIQAGLTPEQGEYRGTPNENAGFLNYLANKEKEKGVQISPQNITDFLVWTPNSKVEEDDIVSRNGDTRNEVS